MIDFINLPTVGNRHNGALKSVIPGDTSFATGQSVAFEYDSKSKIVRWSLGKITVCFIPFYILS
jgi:hypothetical protein